MGSLSAVIPMRGLVAGVMCLMAVCTADAKVVYVNGAITTSGDGSTWGKAYKYLRDALEVTAAGDQIFLAKGIYYPDDGETGEFGNRELAFDLDGQEIYGGFEGTETSIDQRNPVLNETVLSGAIWGVPGEDIYWSMHVTVAYESSTLDGVTVEQGNANGAEWWNYPSLPFYDEGGGCYVVSGNTLTLKTCIFRDNRALTTGGAIMVEGGNGRVVATDCVFEENSIPLYDVTTADNSGGAIKGDVTATNCKFLNNSVNVVPIIGSNDSSATGGAIDGNVTATRCEFIGNTLTASGGQSNAAGGAINGTVSATKCTFSRNSATGSRCSGGAIRGGSLRAVSCVFSENTGGTGTINATDGDGLGGGGAVLVAGGRSTVTTCLFLKNTSAIRGGAIRAGSAGHDDDVTITNCTFLDNGVTGVQGAGLSCTGIVRIMNNIFWHTTNTSGTFNLANQIHVITDGVLRNSDLNYPTPATVAQNVVKGGVPTGITELNGADVEIGNPVDTILVGDPLFVNVADPDGADNIWGNDDDGLRIGTGSSAIGTSRDTRITTFRNFLALDVLDIDEDANVTERLPADLGSFARVQDTYVDMGAYEFGTITHRPEITVEHPAGLALVDGSALVDFGSNPGVVVTKVFTVRNDGTANLNNLSVIINGLHPSSYAITQPSLTSLLPGALTTFTVGFKSSSVAGVRTATLHLSSSDADENPFDINLTGVTLVPEIAIGEPGNPDLVDDVTTVNYGTVAALTSLTKVFTIRNTGLGNLSIKNISVAGANRSEFKVTQAVSNLLTTGATTTFKVTFSPTTAGPKTALINVSNNDPDAESTFTINVSGNAIVAPEIEVDVASSGLSDGGTANFGAVKKGLSYTRVFTIKNTGSSNLKNISASLTGSSNFSKTKLETTTLQPGKSTKISVTFKPSSTGDKQGKLQIFSNDADESPFDITLKGEGIPVNSSAKKKSALVAGGSSKGNDSAGTVSKTKDADGLKYKVLTVVKTPGCSVSSSDVEVSSNLVDWFSGKRHTTVLEDDSDILRVRDNTPVEKGAKRYIRLK